MFSTGAAKGQDINAVSQKLHHMLMSSNVGTAEKTAQDFLAPLGGWTAQVKDRAAAFDKFRQTGVLPDRLKEEE